MSFSYYVHKRTVVIASISEIDIMGTKKMLSISAILGIPVILNRLKCDEFTGWCSFKFDCTYGYKMADQGVTKRCRLSWLLTNSTLVYMSLNAGWGGSCRLSQWVQLYTGAQINFGDITPYLIYVAETPVLSGKAKICNWGTLGDRLCV